MRAAVIHDLGGPESIRVEDVPPPPPPGPGQVQLRILAGALNHLDLFVTRGLPGLKPTFPHILGSDATGVVATVGERVRHVRLGERVLLHPGSWCGACDACLGGEQALCASYGVLGEQLPGLFTEIVNVPEQNLAPAPPDASDAECAAFPLATLTAWRMIVTRAGVQPGETVLVWGIGGGVAQQTLQVAKLRGARVIVTSASDAKLERARALGADALVNHSRDDVVKAVRALAGKRGADVVVDSVGEATWATSLRCLARGGRLVTCGGTTGPMVTTDVRKLFWHHWSVLGSTMGNVREFRTIAGLFARGMLKPVVDRIFPLAEARAAFSRLAAGEQFGKIVLEVG